MGRSHRLLGIAAALAGTSCGVLPADCPDRLRCPEPASGSASGGDNVDGGSMCIPRTDGTIVPDDCGVFVRTSGSDDNPGTKDSPVATIARAVELAAKGQGHVYACAEAFPENISLGDAIVIDGGLECVAGWVYTGLSKSTLKPEKGVPLILRGAASGARISDFVFLAPDGAAAGDSSIAVIADSVTAALTRCSLIAGAGADGAPGLTTPAMQAVAGKAGNAGNPACTGGIVSGGAGASNVCGGTTSSGGLGGQGMSNSGGQGTAGVPALGQGAHGKGDPGSAGWSCAGGGGNGGDGASGSDGSTGSGGTGLGQISVLGYRGKEGSEGKAGSAGQGGGGGGGRAGAGAGVCGPGKGGAAGGGGGAGGCGGAAGGGGMAGGASIALISLHATLSLTSVTLVAGKGGRGGDGGQPQVGGAGGAGGNGGSGVNSGCHGGRGGDGGKGGVGGGGAGGHSIGLAYTGVRPSIEDGWITVELPGAGGASAGSAGASGISMKQQSFE